MRSFAHHDPRSVHDAATRLRYVRGVRERARRSALAPTLALAALSAVLLTHGLLKTLWPHASIVSIVLVASVIAVRPLMRWLIALSEERRGLRAPMRLRLAFAVTALAGVAGALWIGANPLITATAAATAAAAYLAGLPVLSAAAIAAGLLGDAMVAHGMTPPVGELIVGAGLICVAVVGQAKERRDS